VLAQLNLKRVALSVAIAGAILTPIATGSLKKADRESWTLDVEDDQERYLMAHGASRFACSAPEAVALHFHTVTHYANENDRKLCDESKNLFGENVIEKTAFNRAAFIPPARDALLGFFAPLIFVFIAPPIARAYFRWITSRPK